LLLELREIGGTERVLCMVAHADEVLQAGDADAGQRLRLQVEVDIAGERVRAFLPQDGQVIYVMNDGGKTIDTIRYPNGR
jgi:hypothetical protein